MPKLPNAAMKPLIGLILMLLGAAIILFGFGSAVTELVGMYRHAMDDALADGNEQQVASNMWRGAMIGLVGVPPFLIGNFLLGRGLLARLRGK
ncbi:MAG: hypothetical protein AB7K52_03610 [Phycisphaerales bacterium]